MPPFESREQAVADLDMQSVMERPQAPALAHNSLPADDSLPTGNPYVEPVSKVLAYLGQVTECSAAGLLLARGSRLHLVLHRLRHIDDFFLSSMQQRMLSSYRVYAGAVIAQSEPDVVVYGPAASTGQESSTSSTERVPSPGRVVAGPFEPLRSLLVVPVLDGGHVTGMLSVASVFLDAFDGEDLCSLSTLAAQLPLFLDPALDGVPPLDAGPCLAESERIALEREVRARVQNRATSICGLARSWQMQDESSLPEVLRKDLDAIAETALQIRDLVT